MPVHKKEKKGQGEHNKLPAFPLTRSSRPLAISLISSITPLTMTPSMTPLSTPSMTPMSTPSSTPLVTPSMTPMSTPSSTPYCTDLDIDESDISSHGSVDKPPPSATTNRAMDKIVGQIRGLDWGQTINVVSDRLMGKRCTITRIRRYDGYMFSGHGSKNILRYWMDKTANEPEHGYRKIIQMLDSKDYRRYLPIRDWKTFWDSYRDEPIGHRHLFEVICSDQPCKPYLDIEWQTDAQDDAHNKKFIRKIQKDICTVFEKRYQISLPRRAILIASSHSTNKTSYHIVIDHVIDGAHMVYRTNRKHHMDSAWDLWVGLVEQDPAYNDTIDRAVYTTDREFRAIFSNKTKQFRPVIPTNLYGTKPRFDVDSTTLISMRTSTCLRYLCTHTTEPYHYIATPCPSKYQGFGRLANNANYVNNANHANPMYPNQPNGSDCPLVVGTDRSIESLNHMIGLIRPIHPTVEYTGRSGCGIGWRFTYRDRSEPCYTGNTHASNGFYVFEDLATQTVYMKCMSGSCKGMRVLGAMMPNKQVVKKMF
jgi:hypothetical protein